MNILVLQESDWIKRNPHQQHHLMERLSLRGHKIRVIDYEIDWKTNKNNQIFSRRSFFQGVHKIHQGASIDVIRPAFLKIPVLNYFSWAVSNWREINRQKKEFKPDVIVGFGLLNSYIGSRAAKRMGIPFVYYLIDVLYTLIPERAFQFMGKQVKKGIIKNSDIIITINEKLAEFSIGIGGAAEKIKVIGAGIDRKEFNTDVDGSEVREKYKISENDVLLFFMGWVYHFSGVKEVAESLGKSKKEDNVKLMVVGDGDAYPDLLDIRRKYNLEDQIILIGKQPYHKIPGFIAAADICILPAYPDEPIMQDIVPIKIYEYMAMGKPVITTNLPGIMKEFGIESGIIYIDHPKDVIKNIDLDINTLGKKALDFVQDRDWDTITSEFEKILMGFYD